MTTHNLQILLRHRSRGVPVETDFALVKRAPARPGDGEMLCETLYLSLDPYLRGKISGRHLSGAIAEGELMAGEALSRVVESNVKQFPPGAIVAAHSGWQSRPVIAAAAARPIDPRPDTETAPLSTRLGILGMPGLTAYAAMTRLADLQSGDDVVVSAASGPVGSMVGQIAKLRGCRAVGIAGSEQKREWLLDEAGFDACIDYKQEDLRAGLKRACPDGVDVYFDNVGGDVLQANMEQLALGARVILCGLMAQYNSDETPPGPNPGLIIKARATVRGLVVYDHEDLRPEFERQVSAWIKEGKIVWREDLAEGLEAAPALFCRLMRGENFGKAIVQVNAP